MVFDKNQTLVGFQEPLIHMYNKVRYSYHHRLCLRKASCGFQWWSQCQMLVAVLCSRVDVPCTFAPASHQDDTHVKGTPFASEVVSRPNVLLLGDSLGDARMAKRTCGRVQGRQVLVNLWTMSAVNEVGPLPVPLCLAECPNRDVVLRIGLLNSCSTFQVPTGTAQGVCGWTVRPVA